MPPGPRDTKLLICARHHFTLWRAPVEVADAVRRRWPEMKVVHLPVYDGVQKELPDTDIFVGFMIRPEDFVAARKLKWIHCTAANVAQLMFVELCASGITLTNTSGMQKVPMAEHVVGVLVALARRFPDCFRAQAKHRWAQQELWDASVRPRELRGQTLVLVGFGAVGKEIARCVKPFGMRIWAVTRSGRGDDTLADRVLPVADLHRALPDADFLVVCAPITPETHHLIGARQLALLKPAAYLINVGRAALVEEAALVHALEQRTIAGAAIDVFEHEPLPPESPLWTLENLFITPHSSAIGESLWERQTALLIENLERWFDGRELVNRVDLARGY